jgi:hypothetical protein
LLGDAVMIKAEWNSLNSRTQAYSNFLNFSNPDRWRNNIY